MKRVPVLVLLALALVVPGILPATAQQAAPAGAQQAPPIPPAPPTPGATEPTPFQLPLRETVARALEHNLDINVARLDPQINATQVTVADAAFDTTFDSTATYVNNTVQPKSSFQAESSDEESATLMLNKQTRRGGLFSTSLDYRNSNSNYLSGPTQQFGQLLLPHQVATSLSFTFTQSLLRNYGLAINRTAIENALFNQRLSEQQLQTRILSTVELAETSYWTLVGTQRQLDVARSSLDLAKDFLRQTKIRVDVGTLPPIEITTAEAEVASREEAVIVAENAIRNAEDAIRALIAIPPDSPEWNRPIATTDQPGFAPTAVDVDQAIRNALERRPEIVSAQLAVENAQLNERFRNNQVRPDLRVTGGLTLNGSNYRYTPVETTVVNPDTGEITNQTVIFTENKGGFGAFTQLPSRDNYSWFVGGMFSIPLRNRAAKANFTRAKLAVDQANLQLDAAKQAVRVDVRTAARDLETAGRRVATTRANVVLQRQKVDAEQKRYENGLSTAFQVLSFQNDLRNAESSEISALVDYNKALAHLARVQGTILEDRGIQQR